MAITSSIRAGIGTLWRGVLSAASKGQSVWQTVTGITRDYEQAGVPVPGDLVDQVNTFTGFANDWIDAEISIAHSDDGAGITPGMVVTAPWSMDPNEFNTHPGYHLVIGIEVEGQERPVMRTVTGIDALPATVGELRDLALINAYALNVGTIPGGGLGGTVTGISSVVPTIAPSGA